MIFSDWSGTKANIWTAAATRWTKGKPAGDVSKKARSRFHDNKHTTCMPC